MKLAIDCKEKSDIFFFYDESFPFIFYIVMKQISLYVTTPLSPIHLKFENQTQETTINSFIQIFKSPILIHMLYTFTQSHLRIPFFL